MHNGIDIDESDGLLSEVMFQGLMKLRDPD
jgi:hypothetical protein